MSQITGHISQIIGPVIDVYFDTKGLDAESNNCLIRLLSSFAIDLQFSMTFP